MLLSSKYTLYILMYIEVSPHLDCYSVGAADISIEDYAVGSTVLILAILFSYSDGNREIQQTKFQTAVSLQQPRDSMGFTQYSCSAQPELLKDMYGISCMLFLQKWRADLKAFLYIFP